MKARGFVNLRGTATASTNEDSVWPSFTDVMMVIVMVFLMALVVILIRNVDLTDQLVKRSDAWNATAPKRQRSK